MLQLNRKQSWFLFCTGSFVRVSKNIEPINCLGHKLRIPLHWPLNKIPVWVWLETIRDLGRRLTADATLARLSVAAVVPGETAAVILIHQGPLLIFLH